MAYTLRNKIEFDIEGQYKILDEEGNIVYNGRVDLLPDGDVDTLNFAPIFRQLVKPLKYENYLTGINYRVVNTDRRYDIINDTTGLDETITIFWDYSNDDFSGSYNRCINWGIQNTVYQDQYFPLNYNNNTTVYTNIDLVEENMETSAEDIWVNFAVNTNRSFFLMCNIGTIENNRKYYYIDPNTNQKLSDDYYGNECRPSNLVTLYFINANGGLSWVHCDKKKIINNNITRNQIEHQTESGGYETHFGIDNYCIQNFRSFTLNTDFLSNEQSIKIQELFKSPKVWLQEYIDSYESTIISVVLTDTKVTIKNRDNDKLFNYTINCRESTTENIYA